MNDMKQYNIGYILSLLLLLFQTGRAQQRIVSEAELDALQDTPMESLYLHINRSTFFPGEILYYSLYNINMQTYRLSSISKMAYVQLIDANGRIVKTQRIRLERGRGQGDLFINTNYTSGAYKLIAFTNWMKNAGDNQVFQANLTVVNPYEPNAGVLLTATNSIVKNETNGPSEESENLESGIGLLLEADCETCPVESNMRIRLKKLKGALADGNYSLSVARIEEVPELSLPSAVRFSKTYAERERSFQGKMGDTLWIPEQREAIISGRIVMGSDRVPIENTPVVISLPGENFQLLAAKTNAEGQFNMYMKAPYDGNLAFLDLEVNHEQTPQVRFENLAKWKGKLDEFANIRIDTTMSEAIRQRSIHNQIENSYFEAKPDTVISPYSEESYFGNLPRIYDLEAYTRFTTFQEVLVEIIQDVWVKRGPSKQETLWVRAPLEEGREVYTEDPPIVTIDGVWIQDHSKILEFDARKIRYVRVVQESIVWAGRKYQGMVALETVDKNYGSAGIPFTFSPSEPVKRYYFQSNSLKNRHIPDFRHQLYWNPGMILAENDIELVISTSAVPGTYCAELQGFTNYGKPVSLRYYFEVVK